MGETHFSLVASLRVGLVASGRAKCGFGRVDQPPPSAVVKPQPNAMKVGVGCEITEVSGMGP